MANIRRMEIEPADNGFTLTTTHEPENKEKMYDYDSNREKTVHPSVEHLIQHVSKKLKTHKHKKMSVVHSAVRAVTHKGK